MELGLTQKQTQTLSPQMIQSMEILQMGTQELLEYIGGVLQENPVLEAQDPCGAPEPAADLPRRLEWLESADPQNRSYHRQDYDDSGTDPLERCAGPEQTESLYEHLLAQLRALPLPPSIAAYAQLIIASLDQDGWLREDLAELARELGRSVEEIARALTVVQSLEPAGVGARDLSECLCLQLRRRQPVDPLALDVAREHLEALAKNHYSAIARKLGASQADVRRACDMIRTLDPRPGARFAPQESPGYIIPDIIVTVLPDHFELSASDRFLPTLNVSGYYTRMVRENGDGEVREYLAGKLRQAKWIIQAVEQRRSTLMACAECIVRRQADFFRKGPGWLRPMSLADVAQELDIHESTVSRAVKDKYLQCPMGTYSLSSFFSRRLGKGTDAVSSPDRAKALLKALIEKEDKRAPLSDQKLCERMVEQGCAISRRTVAKYRDELGVPGAAARKAYRN